MDMGIKLTKKPDCKLEGQQQAVGHRPVLEFPRTTSCSDADKNVVYSKL